MDIAEKISQMKKHISKDIFTETEDRISAFKINNQLVNSGKLPACVICPDNVNTLQEVICDANEHGINLTVSSSSGGHRKGGFSAAEDHAHIDLSGWKNIDFINRRNRVCQVEPGVTYGELIDSLKPHGMTVSMPLAPRSSKSVVAAVTDREPSVWPNKQWDISDPVASTEFIFGNGEFFRTGAAGGPGSLEKQRAAGGAQKCSMGPSQTDFHRVIQGAQGTMGVISWITMRTELIPSVQKTYLLGAGTLQDLIPFVYDVQRPWLGEHSFILDKVACGLLLNGCRGDDFHSISDSLPEFICLQNICGFETLARERVDYQEADIREIASRYSLDMSSSLGGVEASSILETATKPCDQGDFRCNLKGECLSVFFLTTLDKVPKLAAIYRSIVDEKGFSRNDTGVYVQPVVQNHACHVEFMTVFDPENEHEVGKIRSIEKEAVRKLSKNGAFFSRPYGTAGEVVFAQNEGNYELLKKVKNIFDPAHVLNKGKWGV